MCPFTKRKKIICIAPVFFSGVRFVLKHIKYVIIGGLMSTTISVNKQASFVSFVAYIYMYACIYELIVTLIANCVHCDISHHSNVLRSPLLLG